MDEDDGTEIEFQGMMPVGASIEDTINRMMAQAMQQRIDHRTVGIISNVYCILNAKEPEDRTAHEQTVMRFIEFMCHVTKVSLGMCGHPEPNEPMHREEHITELRIQAVTDFEGYNENAHAQTREYMTMIIEGINERV